MYDSTKADYLQWWGRVDVLIDDNLIHIEAARQLGIKAFIMPRPWNKRNHTVSDMLNTLTKLTN
jgi:FMN phosphatase YigB (HAD superfamily)